MEKIRLNSAARAGAQYAIANSNEAESFIIDGVRQSARDDAQDPALDVHPNPYYKCLDGTEINPQNGDTCSGGEVPMRYIEVDVSGPFEFLFDYPMTTGSMTLQGHAELRLR
jgi:hypothetical protein